MDHGVTRRGPVVTAPNTQRTVAEWMAAGSDSPSDAQVAMWMDEAEDLLAHLWANGLEVVSSNSNRRIPSWKPSGQP
jgi:hypothetical protein